jgi:inhibitor of KinA
MNTPVPYTIFSLGDSALTLDYGNIIEEQVNKRILQIFHELKANPLPGMIEALPAYSSITIYYDVQKLRKIFPLSTAYEAFRQEVENRLNHFAEKPDADERLKKIPVCYETEFGTDLQTIADAKEMSIPGIIQCHLSKTYRVYTIGFLPGFPYMGLIDERIAMPRKEKPEQVKAGSIGIAGIQTGIYPFDSPGGWQIIGRTPLKLFEPEKKLPAYLQPGDIVQFYSITQYEFENYQGGNP